MSLILIFTVFILSSLKALDAENDAKRGHFVAGILAAACAAVMAAACARLITAYLAPVIVAHIAEIIDC